MKVQSVLAIVGAVSSGVMFADILGFGVPLTVGAFALVVSIITASVLTSSFVLRR